MAEIRPFRGIRYDANRVGGLGEILGPPDDILSVERAVALTAGHPYHSVRLEMTDHPDLPVFRESSRRLRAWLDDAILARDAVPAFYVYEHEYAWAGECRRRRGFFAALRLSHPGAGQVLPHERIMQHQMHVRLALLRDVRANLSAIYTVVQDGEDLTRVLEDLTAAKPDQVGTDEEGGIHRLWLVTEPEPIRRLREATAGQPLYIADGHHRYAAALAYRDDRRARCGHAGLADYVLTHIADAADPGIMILPIHRIVRALDGPSWRTALERLEPCFIVDEVAARGAIDERALSAAVEQLAEVDGLPAFLLLGPGGGPLLRLRLRAWSDIDWLLPDGGSVLSRRLDVTVLDAVVLQHALGIREESMEDAVDFTPDIAEAYGRVASGAAAAAVFVRPTPMQSLLAVARAGELMPHKSTYFYPKVPIGLVIYDLEEEGHVESGEDTDPTP